MADYSKIISEQWKFIKMNNKEKYKSLKSSINISAAKLDEIATNLYKCHFEKLSQSILNESLAIREYTRQMDAFIYHHISNENLEANQDE